MKRVRLSLLLFASILAMASVSLGQRPKVGLTLGGGGAKGLAHIGILEAIDSAGLKIDYLTGTSMGAVVGAIYAAGYSGRDIERIALNINWLTLFRNAPIYKDVSLSEKSDFDRYWLEIPLNKFRSAVSSGLIDPEEIWLKFLQILYPVYKIKDFHKLSIPFECLATNVVNGEPVVLSSGNLVPAIRSSMAIPTVFTPVDYQGLLLVDGGLVRNFPVRYAKELGADITIGVSLYSGLLTKDQIKTALDVFNQITSYVDAADEIEEKKMCDILISPPVGNYTAASFGEYKKIIQIGIEEGRKMYPVFKKLADSLNAIEPIEYDPYKRLKEEPKVTVDTVKVVGLDKSTSEILLDNVDIYEGGTYSGRQLSRSLSNAYSTLNYKFIYYDLEPTGKENHANIRIVTQQNSKSWAKVGLTYNTFTGAALDLNYTYSTFNATQNRISVSGVVGENYAGALSSRWLFSRRLRNMVQVDFSFTGLKLPIYKKSMKQLSYNTKYYTARVMGGTFFNRYTGLLAGLDWRYKTYSPNIATVERYRGNEMQLYAFANLKVNSLNRKFFPSSGVRTKVEARYAFCRDLDNKLASPITKSDSLLFSFNNRPFYRLLANFDGYFPINENFTLISSLNIGALLDFDGLYFSQFFIGGEYLFIENQMPFVGLRDAQLITNSFAGALLGIQTNIFRRVYFQTKVNFGILNFVGKESTINYRNAPKIWGYGISGGYLFSKVPVQLSLSYSPYISKVYASFSLGYSF